MNAIDSPSVLAERLSALFPLFAGELAGEELENYHQVIQLLTPRITGYLEHSSNRTIEKFCVIVNEMAEAGGEKENAISTCLLEHASQLRLRRMIWPYLGVAARRELK